MEATQQAAASFMSRQEAINRITINRLHRNREAKRFTEASSAAKLEHWKTYNENHGIALEFDELCRAMRVRDETLPIPEGSIVGLMAGEESVLLW